MPVIEVVEFHKVYDGMAAVAGLTFQVGAGDILGLVGPNGAGKTTTMRALSGLIPPSRGTLSICSHDVQREPIAAKSRLAYIPDDPQLFPDLTVAEHLAFAASAYGISNADERAAELAEQFALATRWRATAGSLSRGMRQKLAICCGYLHEPDAILFDEPLTGLDPHGIRTLKESIRARAAQGAAVVISSHLLAMVEDICTHVLILDHGQSRFFGRLGELKASYLSTEESASLENIFFLATQTRRNGSSEDASTVVDEIRSQEMVSVTRCRRM